MKWHGPENGLRRGRNFRRLVLFALCTAVVSVSAAEWIQPASASFADADVGLFRKTFVLDGPVVSASLNVAALGAFEARVNGTLLPGYLNGGCTQPEKCRHEYPFDVARQLHVGTNEVLVSVAASWWRDEIMRRHLKELAGYPRDSAVRAVLDVKFADGTRKTFGTDGSWDATYGGTVVRAGIFEGEVQNLMRKDFRWAPAVPNRDFAGEVRPMRGPWIGLREDLVLRPREKLPLRLEPRREYVFDFGQNAAAIERMVVEGNRLTKVTVRHAEMLNEPEGDPKRGNDGPGGTLYTINLRYIPASSIYVLRDGEQTLQPHFTYFGYRYVGITVTAPVVLKSLESIPVTSVAREMETSGLETGDEDVNRLVSNILWGFRSNYLSIPTDCPQRNERLGWTADTMVFTPAASYLADVRGFLGKWLADLRDGQSDEGAYEQVAPLVLSGSHRKATSGWSDAGILVPYFLWKHYGAREIVEEGWESMKRYMAYLDAHDGPDRSCYGDWLAFEPQSPEYCKTFSAFYWVWDAQAMKEMATAFGKAEDAALFAAQEKRARRSFAEKYLDGDGLIHKRFRQQATDLYMLKLGLCGNAAARTATRDDLVANIRGNGDRLKTGFMGTAILMDTLTEIGETELAYSLLLQHGHPSWLYSVDQGATTVWERWNSYTKEKGFGNADMNSFNHYAYGAVYAWMMRTVAGIRPDPDEPGFRRFVLAPIPDRRLGRAKAYYDSPCGRIESEWKYEADGLWRWTYVVPAGTTARIVLPDGTSFERAAGRWTDSCKTKEGADSRVSGRMAGGPRLKVGIVTDTHIQTDASAFEKALRYFRDRGVDAVLHNGDISDWGTVSGWRLAAEAWERVFPGNRAPDGHEVVRLFTTGNHDFEGVKYWDQEEEMLANGISKDELLVDNDLPAQWEKCFGRKFEPITRWNVKGYDFITVHWNHSKEIVPWMKEHGKEFDPKRPFFYFQHLQPDGTVAAGCKGDFGAAMEAFSAYPNAVVIGGHTHLSLTDGHQIWQGAFTALCAGTMSWSELPFGYENARPIDWRDKRVQQMPVLADRFYQRTKQGLVMSVYDHRIVFERRDFSNDVELGAPWVVPLPLGREKPFAWDAQAATLPIPQFAADAALKVRTVVAEDRRGEKAVQLVLDFPTADRDGVRAYDYEVRVEPEGGEPKVVCRVVSPTYNCGPSCECREQRAVVSVRELPKGTPYRMAVAPRNCFGGAGVAIRSPVRKNL